MAYWIQDLHEFAVRDSLDEATIGSAVVFIDSPILKVCDLIDLLGYNTGDRELDTILTEQVRDYADIKAEGEIDETIANQALKMLDVDLIGLDFMDRTFLKAIIEKFSGGPVGLDNLAAAIGEEKETIEDVIEPYLIQQGFLMRTPRGRKATQKTYEHLGVSRGSVQGDLF